MRNRRNFVVLHSARYELNFIHRSFSLVGCSHAVEVSGVPPEQLKQNLRSLGRSLKSQ